MKDYKEKHEKLRLEMRETLEGQFLMKMGYDYYDTESSARRVAEFAVKEIEQLKKINEQLQNKLYEIQDSHNDISNALNFIQAKVQNYEAALRSCYNAAGGTLNLKISTNQDR